MAYIDYSFFTSLYGDIPEKDFNRIEWDAERMIDNATTGVDGYNKLKNAFPSTPDDSEAVKRCVAKLVDIIRDAELSTSLVQTADGVHGGIISSISAGNESVSFSAGATALTDKSAKDKLLHDTITEYLSGVHDGNGVNLLYMGAYPTIGGVAGA